MTTIKKSILALAASSVLAATGAQANDKVVQGAYINIGAAQFDAGEGSKIGYLANFNANNHFENKVYIGGGFDYILVDSNMFLAGDLDVGYNVYDRTTAYLGASFELKDDFSGVGYNVGVKYALGDNFQLDLKYRNVTLSFDNVDIDTSAALFSIGYHFKTYDER